MGPTPEQSWGWPHQIGGIELQHIGLPDRQRGSRDLWKLPHSKTRIWERLAVCRDRSSTSGTRAARGRFEAKIVRAKLLKENLSRKNGGHLSLKTVGVSKRGTFSHFRVPIQLSKIWSKFSRMRTRWAPTIVHMELWGPYTWPYKWVTHFITPINGVITALKTGTNPPCTLYTSYWLLGLRKKIAERGIGIWGHCSGTCPPCVTEGFMNDIVWRVKGECFAPV